jgi:hypothetical protein
MILSPISKPGPLCHIVILYHLIQFDTPVTCLDQFDTSTQMASDRVKISTLNTQIGSFESFVPGGGG